MKNPIKKTLGAVLTAVTLSACVVLPASVDQPFSKISLATPITAEAADSAMLAEGIVNVEVAKMYDKNFKPFPTSNVLKDTHVAILDVKGNYYKVSDAYGGMYMKIKEIKLCTKAKKSYEVLGEYNPNGKEFKTTSWQPLRKSADNGAQVIGAFGKGTVLSGRRVYIVDPKADKVFKTEYIKTDDYVNHLGEPVQGYVKAVSL